MDPPIIKKRDPFLIHQIKSFRFAFEGIFFSFQKGTHFKMQLFAFIIVVAFGVIYSISPYEWLTIILISSIILGSEAINTAIEETCDVLHPEHHPGARLAKHCAAGGVLILSIASIIIGLIIFLPKIFA